MKRIHVKRLSRDYLTFEQASREYKVSVSCLRRATKDPDNPLPYCKPGDQSRGYTLRRHELEKWLDSCMVYGDARS